MFQNSVTIGADKTLPTELVDFLAQQKEKPDFIVKSSGVNFSPIFYNLFGMIVILTVVSFAYFNKPKTSARFENINLNLFGQKLAIDTDFLLYIGSLLIFLVATLLWTLYRSFKNKSWYIGMPGKLFEYRTWIDYKSGWSPTKGPFIPYEWKDFTGKTTIKGNQEKSDLILETNVINSAILNLKGQLYLRGIPKVYEIDGILKRRIVENAKR